MNRFMRLERLFVLASWLVVLAPALTQAALRSSFEMNVPSPPTPVDVDGKPRLVYELHLTNFARDALTLTRLQVVNADDASIVYEVRDADLAKLVGRPGMSPETSDRRVIGPGMRAVIYLGFPIDRATAKPRTLRHRIEFDVIHPDERERASAEGAVMKVGETAPIMLDPPVRGGPWIAIYDPFAERGHRRMIFALEGHARIPARFAIDWIKLDEHGKFARGDEKKIANWYGYGADVLAVADSVVAAARDDVAESATLSNERHALEDASGNYVALDLGQGRYAFYEHLKPGSIKVKAGDRVHSGQVIGALGYTGDSTGPHLHFHVADAKSPLLAEGLPYVFKRFDVLGVFETMDAFAKGELWSSRPQDEPRVRDNELPAANTVLQFR